MQLNTWYRLISIGIACTAMLACNKFEWQESVQVPRPIRTVYFTPQVHGEDELSYYIRENLPEELQIELVGTPQSADAVIAYARIDQEKLLLKAGVDGAPHQYRITHRIGLHIQDANGQDFFPPRQLVYAEEAWINHGLGLITEVQERQLRQRAVENAMSELVILLKAQRILEDESQLQSSDYSSESEEDRVLGFNRQDYGLLKDNVPKNYKSLKGTEF